MKNNNLKLKISVLLIFSLLLFPLQLNKIEAASTTLSKTVEFFVEQDAIVRASGEQFSFYFNNVIIPETPTVKSAIIEINGVSYNNSGNQTINVDLQQGATAAGAGTDYALAGTTKPKPFTIKYDAWQNGAGSMQNITAARFYDYTLYLKEASAGGTGAYSISSAKLILTYSHPASGTNFLKTNKYFIDQKIGQTSSGTEISKDFNLTISEQTPEIRSVFVEIGGIAKGSGAGTIEASVVDQGNPANYTSYNLDLSSSQSTAKFLVLYDASSKILSSDFPGNKNYTLYLKGTGFDTNLWSAKLIVTYKYSETGGLPISGYVISSTVDTEIAQGAGFNSLMWKGNLNGGKIRLQIATSDLSTGPWTFTGPDCTVNTFYEPLPDTPEEIKCYSDHNNKQYFRYKVILCSNDCISAGTNNPEMTDVVVNWAK